MGKYKMYKLLLTSVLLISNTSVMAKDISYYIEKDLTVTLTNDKCNSNGYVAKAKLPKYPSFNGCYMIKNNYVMIIWQNDTTSLFKTTDFQPFTEL